MLASFFLLDNFLKGSHNVRSLFVALLTVVCLLGCNREERLILPEAILEGTITYKGKPVPHAMVVATGEGPAAQGFANADGKFQLKNCPTGSLKLGVNTDAGKGNMMGAMMSSQVSGDKSAKPVFVDIPKKYFDPNTSGIVAQVSDPKGVTQFDIKID